MLMLLSLMRAMTIMTMMMLTRCVVVSCPVVCCVLYVAVRCAMQVVEYVLLFVVVVNCDWCC